MNFDYDIIYLLTFQKLPKIVIFEHKYLGVDSRDF